VTAAVQDEASNVVAVAKGAGFLAGGRAFSTGIRFVTAVILARLLGAEDYGLYILMVSIAFAVASVASLGLDLAMERHIAVASRRDDRDGANGSLQVGMWGTLIPALIGAALLAGLADVIAHDIMDEPGLEPLLQVSAVLSVLYCMTTLMVSVIVGCKRIDQAALANHVIQPVARLVFILLLAVVGMTAYLAGIALVLSYVVVIGVLLSLINRRIPLVGLVRPARRDMREIVAFAFPAWYAGVLRIVRTRIQPLLLGAAGSAANVGVFSVVTSASALGQLAMLSINAALRPTLAELHDAGDAAEVGRLYATTTRWTLAASLPLFLFMVLAPESLLGLFGATFESGATALVIAASAEVVNAGTGMCGTIIAMSGHNKLKVVNATVWMVVTVGANVVMIPLWGVIGAALAILVSTVMINVLRVVEVWVLMRILPWDRHIWKTIAATAGAAGAGALAVAALPPMLGVVALVALALGIGLVFVVILAVLGFEPDDRMVIDELRQRGRRLVDRVKGGVGSRRTGRRAPDSWS
jgi:O-antigen/teichoic acid export membrane protein